jgi:cell shape-determining protein MreC
VFPGQILVTSGVEGSQFPQGLPIGVVTAVNENQGALQTELSVEQLAATSDLSYVSVVVWEPVRP